MTHKSMTAGAQEVSVLDWAPGSSQPEGPQWVGLDDVIMGGVSSSRLAVDQGEGALVFSGEGAVCSRCLVLAALFCTSCHAAM